MGEAFPFAAFDVETTGLHGLCDRIVEVGAVRFGLAGKGEEFGSLVHPGRVIPWEVTALHGIDDAMVAGAPSFAEVCEELIPFLADSILVAHNAPFDVSFLVAECDRAGAEPPPIGVIDSCDVSRCAFPELEQHSLDFLVSALEIDRSRGHRALPDAIASADLLLLALRRMGVDSAEGMEAWLRDVTPPLPLERVGFRLHPELPPAYRPIAVALEGGADVTIVYTDRLGNRSRRAVVPIRVAELRGTFVMEAFCRMRRTTRCFRLDRIVSIG